MTPQTFQTIAKAVHKDMATMREWSFAKMVSGGQLVASEMDHFEDLEVLSKIGASGDEVSNCLRDLGRHLAQVINHQGVAAYATKHLGTTCLCVALCKLGTHHANSRFVSHPSSFPDAGHRPVVMGSRSKTGFNAGSGNSHGPCHEFHACCTSLTPPRTVLKALYRHCSHLALVC